MGVLWLLSVFCLSCMICVHCQTSDDYVTSDDTLQALFDLETLESSFENVMADQPEDPEPSDSGELSVVYSVLMRPSVFRKLEKLEEIIPLSADRKYKVLDDLIDYMHLYTLGLPLFNCSTELQLFRYIELSSSLVQSILKSEGGSKCVFQRLQNPSRFGMLAERLNLSPSTTENPCSSSTTENPCSSSTTENPCSSSTTENNAFPPLVGSVRGIPGIHYPDYIDVPITNFSCADKKVPGFYADLDTGCQVFHVCYEHRRESFLCPIGTVFNQPILACDYWYSSNCSQAPLYYDTIKKDGLKESLDIEVEDLVSVLINSETEVVKHIEETKDVNLDDITPFLPVKAVVTEFEPEKPKGGPVKPKSENVELLASDIFDKLITSATKATSKTRHAIGGIPEPEEKYKPDKLEMFTKSQIPLAKAKMAIPAGKGLAMKAAMPVMATKAKVAAALPAKIAAAKIAGTVPIVAKAKIATIPAAKIAIGKAKLAAVSPLAAKAKVLPKIAVKSKMASAVPIAKAKMYAPLMKGKMVKGAGAPLLKAKAFGLPLAKTKMAGSIPLAKVKLAKAAAISPLTKKALALGYMKLLKAKKLAMMG